MSDVSASDLSSTDRGGVLENDLTMDEQGGGGGGCPPGEECLPDDFIDPDDCPGCPDGEECLPSNFVEPCPEGQECLPSDFIDPDDCPGCVGDYVPFCLNENADDVDTLILALTPFAYYPMDDASGLIQDASGNGNHATAAQGTAAYAQAPITSKVGNSIRFDGQGFTIPKPQATLGGGAAWSFIWLQLITVWHGTGSTAEAPVPFGVSQSSNSDALTLILAGGDLYVIFAQDGAQNYASYFPEADLVGRVAVIALVCNGDNQPQMYVDGVRWGATQTAGAGSGNDLRIGSMSDGFWGHSDMRMSNLASFDRGLTHAEVLSITEALHDAASLAACLVP